MKAQIRHILWLASIGCLLGFLNLRVEARDISPRSLDEGARESVLVEFTFGDDSGEGITIFDKDFNEFLTVIDDKADVIRGHQIVINAKGKDGRTFYLGKWWKTGQSDRNDIKSLPLELRADYDLSISLTFQYQVTYSVRGEGGGSVQGFFLDRSDPYAWYPEEIPFTPPRRFFLKDRDTFKFKATPKDGYRVKAWYLNGEVIEGEKGLEYTINQPKISINVEVEFESDSPVVEEHSLTISLIGGKDLSVKYEGDEEPVAPVDGVYKVKKGRILIIDAEQDNDRHLTEAYWSEDGGVTHHDFTELPLRLPVEDNDLLVSITFRDIVLYSVRGAGGTLEARVCTADPNGLEVPIASGDPFDPTSGKRYRFYATAEGGYRTSCWYLDGVRQDGPLERVFEVDAPQKSFNVEVSFEVIPQHNVTLAAAPSNAAESLTIWIKAGDDLFTPQPSLSGSFPEGSCLRFSAAAITGYTLEAFYISGTRRDYEVDDSGLHFFILDKLIESVSVIAQFDPHVTFAPIGESGTLSAQSESKELQSKAPVKEGKTIIFTATPNPYHVVARWVVNGVDYQMDGKLYVGNTLEITMTDKPLDVRVEFAPQVAPEVQVTFSTSDTSRGTLSAFNVSVEPEKSLVSPAVVELGTAIEFRLTLKDGYKLSRWSVNGSPVAPEIDGTGSTRPVLRITLSEETVLDNRLTVIAELKEEMSVEGLKTPFSNVYLMGGQLVIESAPGSHYAVHFADGMLIADGFTTSHTTCIPISRGALIVTLQGKSYKVLNP